MTAIHNERSVLGLTIEPLREFTQKDQRLGRSYLLYPTSIDAGCRRFYIYPQPFTDKRYKVGRLVTVYGLREEAPGLGDLAVSSNMIEPVHPDCDENDVAIIPKNQSANQKRCASELFQIYKVFSTLPVASIGEIDQQLLWLSETTISLPYEKVVRKYADPERVNDYLEHRYGDILNTNCAVRPKMLRYTASQEERDANRRYRVLWHEHCNKKPNSDEERI